MRRLETDARVAFASGPGDRTSPARARDRREQTVEDILHEPVELIDQDLDKVAGGLFDFNNFDSNQGDQGIGLGAFNNQDSNQGLQVGIGVIS